MSFLQSDCSARNREIHGICVLAILSVMQVETSSGEANSCLGQEIPQLVVDNSSALGDDAAS